MLQLAIRSSFIAFALVALGSCALLQKAVKQPLVAFESFRMGESNDKSITLIPRLRITNQNDFSIPLDKLNYNLMLNERNIFSGATNVPGALESNTPKSIDIPVTLTQETLDFFVNSLTQDKMVNYTVTGDASVAGFAVPFDRKGQIFMPEVEVGEFNVNSASLSNLDMSLDLSVLNKNSFDLPFTGLFYEVTSKGKDLFKNEIKQNGIKQQATTKMTIPVRVNPSNIISSSLQLLTNPNLDIDVNAAANLGFTKLPFSTSKKINLKEYIGK